MRTLYGKRTSTIDMTLLVLGIPSFTVRQPNLSRSAIISHVPPYRYEATCGYAWGARKRGQGEGPGPEKRIKKKMIEQQS